MNTRANDPIRHRRFRRFVGMLGLSAMVAVAAASPALADNDRGRGNGPGQQRHGRQYDDEGRHDNGRHKGHFKPKKARYDDRHRRYGYDVHRHGRARFDVPRHIHRHDARRYGAYYHERVYDRGHRHHHVVYRFPVYTSHGLYYRHYPYCEGTLYRDGISGFVTFQGRNVSIGIGF